MIIAVVVGFPRNTMQYKVNCTSVLPCICSIFRSSGSGANLGVSSDTQDKISPYGSNLFSLCELGHCMRVSLVVLPVSLTEPRFPTAMQIVTVFAFASALQLQLHSHTAGLGVSPTLLLQFSVRQFVTRHLTHDPISAHVEASAQVSPVLAKEDPAECLRDRSVLASDSLSPWSWPVHSVSPSD